jgi:hypothetical protein
LLGELRKPRKPSVRIANVPAKIRAKYLSNTTQEHYRYASPFVENIQFNTCPQTDFQKALFANTPSETKDGLFPVELCMA